MSVNEQDVLMVRDKLQSLEKKPMDSFKKNLKAMAYLTFLLEKNHIKPIIVGGHAVELYTSGHYTTVDVDLVLSGREKAGQLLKKVKPLLKKHRLFFLMKINKIVDINNKHKSVSEVVIYAPHYLSFISFFNFLDY